MIFLDLQPKVNPPGPCITSIIDFRKMKSWPFADQYVIEDGTSPTVANIPYTVGMAIASKLIGDGKYPKGQTLEKIFQVCASCT